MEEIIKLTVHHPEFDIRAVMAQMAEATKTITIQMVRALIKGHQEEMDIFGFALQYQDPMLNEKLLGADDQTLLVYRKLMESVAQFIAINSSEYLAPMLGMVGDEMAGIFIGSFVFPYAETITEKLKREQPAALEATHVWKHAEAF